MFIKESQCVLCGRTERLPKIICIEEPLRAAKEFDPHQDFSMYKTFSAPCIECKKKHGYQKAFELERDYWEQRLYPRVHALLKKKEEERLRREGGNFHERQ